MILQIFLAKCCGIREPAIGIGCSRINPLASGIAAAALILNVGPVVAQAPPPGAAAAISTVSSSFSGMITSLETGFHRPISAIVSRPDSCGSNQLMGGPFIRAAAGDSRIDSVGRSNTAPSSNSRTKTTFSGINAGVDAGICNINATGWNLNFGLMGGFVRADAKSNGSSVGPVFVETRAKSESPFIGVYSFLTNGPFTAEFSIRYDVYDARVTTPNTIPLIPVPFFIGPDARVKGEGILFNSNVSYKFAIGEQFFVEPVAGVSIGRTTLDQLQLATGPGDVGKMRATNSYLGRLGANLGATFVVNDNLILQPFFHLAIWHEFAPAARTRTTLASLGGLTFDVTVERVGTFGQAGLGLQAKIANTPFQGFVRGDIRFGSRIEGKAINMGLRAQF